MDAFDWMMKKTATIPEIRRIDEELLFNHSHSTPSIFKKFHVLIYLISVYHILFSKYLYDSENLYEILDFQNERKFENLLYFRSSRYMELIKIQIMNKFYIYIYI